MEDNYLLVEDDDSYYICFRNERRAERLRQIRQRKAWEEEENQPRKRIDVPEFMEAVGYLLISLSIFSFPFWLALAGALIERLGW